MYKQDECGIESRTGGTDDHINKVKRVTSHLEANIQNFLRSFKKYRECVSHKWSTNKKKALEKKKSMLKVGKWRCDTDWTCLCRPLPRLPSSCSYKRDDYVKPYKAPKADPGEGCPRCGGKVYAAEEMLAKGKVGNPLCVLCNGLGFSSYGGLCIVGE